MQLLSAHLQDNPTNAKKLYFSARLTEQTNSGVFVGQSIFESWFN